MAACGLRHGGAYERAGAKPRYRRLRYGVAPGHICLRLAILESLERFFSLVGCQLRRTTELHTTGHRTGAAVTCPGEDQLALELGKSAQDRQHQPAMRGGGVRPCTVQRLEAGAGTSDRE
jgi:hypothetical protein